MQLKAKLTQILIIQIGNGLKIDFDIESRYYNSKWYTDTKARKIEIEDTTRKVLWPML